MTKVRSREECFTALQNESAWRKKEIASLGILARGNDFDQSTALRASIVLLYAHWEGFVKSACYIYISFINEQIARSQPQLSLHFSSIRRWKIARQQGGAGSLKNPMPWLLGLSAVCCDNELLPLDIIDTESNLNSSVLRKLVGIIDVDYGSFLLKEKLIDDVLLSSRNAIAHGERVAILLSEYEDTERQILELLNDFQNKVETAIQSEAYKLAA